MKKSLKILSLLVAITMLVQMFNFSFISKASEDNVSDSKNQSLSIINNDFYYENVSLDSGDYYAVFYITDIYGNRVNSNLVSVNK